jgi:hypothetical protein
MLEWLFEWLFKPYIDKLVDRRIKENMFERYWQQKNEDIRQRIERLRRTLNSPTQGVSEETSEELLPSSGIQKKGWRTPSTSHARSSHNKKTARDGRYQG